MGKGSYTGGSTVITTRNNNIRSVSTLKRTLNSALTSIQITEKRLLTNVFTKKNSKYKCSLAISKQSSILKKVLPELLLFKTGIYYVESILDDLRNLSYFDSSYLKNFIIKLRKAKENFNDDFDKKITNNKIKSKSIKKNIKSLASNRQVNLRKKKIDQTDRDINLRDYISKMILDIEKIYKFNEGYKLLYCPWKTLNDATIAFISLNPGSNVPHDAEMKLISDERGNTYEIEKDTTKSPITNQFLLFCNLINMEPIDVLTGTIFPFRSKDWNSLSFDQKNAGLLIGKHFWSKSLENIKLIVCAGKVTAEHTLGISDFKFDLSINSGWGNIEITRYRDSKGRRLIQLPHLSTFKLFSRTECLPSLKKIFDL